MKPSWEQHHLPIAAAGMIFCTLSLWAAIKSEGFLEADAITHYLYARFAFQEPHYFTNVWGRPLCTGLYAVPAYFFGRIGVRVTALLLALLVAWCAYAIARRQNHRWPALAVIFTLAQPLVFLHSFAELTELPFAAVLGLAFLAYQKRQFALMALLIGISPMGRPEGFGLIGLAGLGLIVHRRWIAMPLLIVPLLMWNLAGWLINGSPVYQSQLPHGVHWLLWLKHEWPYAGESLYPRGHVLKYIALLPAAVGPFLLPAVLLGIWRSLTSSAGRGEGPPVTPGTRRSLTPSPSTLREGRGEGLSVPPLPEYRKREHLRRCEWLIATIPLLILVGHSILHAMGKMASSGELRYLLIVAPFWGLLAARGWECIVLRLDLKSPLRYAGILAMLPCLIHCKTHIGGYTFGYSVLPLELTDDMLAAKRFVEWYEKWPLREQYPRVMAAHPGVFYYLDLSPTDPTSATDWNRENVESASAGQVAFWDYMYSIYNADARRSTGLDLFQDAHWVGFESKPIRYPSCFGPSRVMWLSPLQANGEKTDFIEDEHWTSHAQPPPPRK